MIRKLRRGSRPLRGPGRRSPIRRSPSRPSPSRPNSSRRSLPPATGRRPPTASLPRASRPMASPPVGSRLRRSPLTGRHPHRLLTASRAGTGRLLLTASRADTGREQAGRPPDPGGQPPARLRPTASRPGMAKARDTDRLLGTASPPDMPSRPVTGSHPRTGSRPGTGRVPGTALGRGAMASLDMASLDMARPDTGRAAGMPRVPRSRAASRCGRWGSGTSGPEP
jgi:hypothetical protein